MAYLTLPAKKVYDPQHQCQDGRRKQAGANGQVHPPILAAKYQVPWDPEGPDPADGDQHQSQACDPQT